MMNLTVDYLVSVTAIILSTSIPEYNVHMYIGILAFIGILVAISHIDRRGQIMINFLRNPNPRRAYIEYENQKLTDLLKKGEEKQKNQKIIYFSFMTFARSMIIIATVFSILEVDFPNAYPRRFCKTEESGISLLVVGVGAVMFATGMSARKVREETTG